MVDRRDGDVWIRRLRARDQRWVVVEEDVAAAVEVAINRSDVAVQWRGGGVDNLDGVIL